MLLDFWLVYIAKKKGNRKVMPPEARLIEYIANEAYHSSQGYRPGVLRIGG